MFPLDRALFRWVNRIDPAWDPVFLFFSEGNKWTAVRIGLAVLVLLLLLRKQTRAAAAAALLAWPLANALTEALKNLLPSLRPSATVAWLIDVGWPPDWARALDPGVHLRIEPLSSFGTTSSHSANMMSIAVAFAVLAPKWAPAWFVVAFLVGTSRVVMGVHYPTQVLLGWTCGAWVGWLVAQTIRAGMRLAAATRDRAKTSGPAEPAEPR